MTSCLHTMARNRQRELGVYWKWLSRGQHGFDTAANTRAGPRAAASDRGQSLIFTIALLRKWTQYESRLRACVEWRGLFTKHVAQWPSCWPTLTLAELRVSDTDWLTSSAGWRVGWCGSRASSDGVGMTGGVAGGACITAVAVCSESFVSAGWMIHYRAALQHRRPTRLVRRMIAVVIGVNLAEMLGEPEWEHYGLDNNLVHNQRPSWVGMGGDWIGFWV